MQLGACKNKSPVLQSSQVLWYMKCGAFGINIIFFIIIFQLLSIQSNKMGTIKCFPEACLYFCVKSKICKEDNSFFYSRYEDLKGGIRWNLLIDCIFKCIRIVYFKTNQIF